MGIRATVVLACCLAGIACGGAPRTSDAFDEAAWSAGVEDWRQQRLNRLTSDGGWLSLVGLDWLEEGENRFGSGPGNRIRFPEGLAPVFGGTLVLRDGEVRLEPAPGVEMTVNDEPAAARVLGTDANGPPDVVRIGDLTFYDIARSERLGVRSKHPEAPARVAFEGLEYFPIDPAYRVTAEFVPYDPPREVLITTVIGTVEKMLAPGYVRFRLDGEEHTLEPVVDDPADEDWFFIFKDGTSGLETYPAGRFLYTDRAQNGRVVLDFNRAYNPPCAFTGFATCPLPPPANRLRVRIEAGEKTYGHHGDPSGRDEDADDGAA